MGVLIENWVKFARLFLNSIIKIIDVGEINYNDFVQFKPEYALISKDFEFENNFPFSALHYESRITKQLFPLHNDLLSVPPTNFEVLETLNYLTNAEDLINNYKFEEASKVLNDSLKVFNKYYQQKIVASILLLLRKIAALLNQQNIALNYLKSALDVAKSGNVPIEYIIKIHYKSGKTLFELKDFDGALNHFDIIIKFLENEKTSLNNEEILGMAYLYKGLINSEQRRVSESKYNFKKAIDIGNNAIKVKLKYYLLRARHFKEKGNLSNAKNLIKMGLNYIGIEFKD
jgi:tetratricopeptide (TPR) repeat protein